MPKRRKDIEAWPIFDPYRDLVKRKSHPRMLLPPTGIIFATGLWGMTPAVDIKLDKGPQTLRISAPCQREVAVRFRHPKSKQSRIKQPVNAKNLFAGA